MSDFRAGLGWDIHRLERGRPLVLGGVRIPAEFGLSGHSDADVLAHAVTDAILGAAALGDIGLHFPDTDPQWKGKHSLHFLAHAAKLAREQGYEVSNVDAIIILERPKLRNYRDAIRAKLAETLGLARDRVSVKFKTAEAMGAVGEGQAAEARAIALLISHPSSVK